MRNRQEMIGNLRLILLALIVAGTLSCCLPVAAQSQPDEVTELVDSGQTGGIDLFSDTTAVDTGQQVAYDIVDDSDSSMSDFEVSSGMFFTMAILFTALLALFMLGLVLFPIIILILFLVLIVRRSRKRERKLNEMEENLNAQNKHQKIEIEMEKKLRRSQNQMLGGVCAGLAEYFDLDPTVVRVAYVLLTFFTAFSGVIIYLVLLLLMPRE